MADSSTHAAAFLICSLSEAFPPFFSYLLSPLHSRFSSMSTQRHMHICISDLAVRLIIIQHTVHTKFVGPGTDIAIQATALDVTGKNDAANYLRFLFIKHGEADSLPLMSHHISYISCHSALWHGRVWDQALPEEMLVHMQRCFASDATFWRSR